MRRYVWAFVLLFLVACSSPASTRPTEQCAWRYDSQGRPDQAAKIATGLRDAGLQGATVTVTDVGESCGDRFARQYGAFRVKVPVADIADTPSLSSQETKALGVLKSFATAANDKISITFESGGQTVVREYKGG